MIAIRSRRSFGVRRAQYSPSRLVSFSYLSTSFCAAAFCFKAHPLPFPSVLQAVVDLPARETVFRDFAYRKLSIIRCHVVAFSVASGDVSTPKQQPTTANNYRWQVSADLLENRPLSLRNHVLGLIWMVEPTGIEPATFSLRTRRSTN